jgi:hypothetical protein
MNDNTICRRRVVAGVAAALGGVAIAPAAQAFPRSAAARFRAASEILAPFGVSVRGASANGRVSHDVLSLEVEPRANTQVDHVVGHRDELGGIIPCIKTSVFEGVDELSLYDPLASAIDPCMTTVRQGGVVVSEHFDPGATRPDPSDGEIIPCIRTTVAGPLATFEAFDATAGDIIPCIRVQTEMLPGGALGAIALEVDPGLDFSVQVGDRLYRLEGGELVEAAR